MPLIERERHYSIRPIDFQDFWDLCGHFQRAHPELRDICYSVEGLHETFAEKESDVSAILGKMAGNKSEMLYFQAELSDIVSGSLEKAVLTYRARPIEGAEPGLSFKSPGISKINLHNFEEVLLEQYGYQEEDLDLVEFGRPCEVLAAVLDMRGFSKFCEQPNIESPYICGLMYSFFKMANHGFSRYPPEMIKFTGDGLVAVWETNHQDRELAIESCMRGVINLNRDWQTVRKRSQFSHGAPDSIGIGISFGLGSAVPQVTDYIGRPINLASRLCAACPGGEILIDKSIPTLSPRYHKEDSSVHVKSFGRYYVWRVQAL